LRNSRLNPKNVNTSGKITMVIPLCARREWNSIQECPYGGHDFGSDVHVMLTNRLLCYC
jgi:hypothetical protein